MRTKVEFKAERSFVGVEGDKGLCAVRSFVGTAAPPADAGRRPSCCDAANNCLTTGFSLRFPIVSSHTHLHEMSSLALTAGVEMVASLLSLAFFGALLVSVFEYFQRFPDDRWHYRLLVACMVSLAFADTVMNCNLVYDLLIVHFSERESTIGRGCCVRCSPRLGCHAPSSSR